MTDKDNHQRVKFLLDRLERISADSSWAHQASGIRSALSKSILNKNSRPETVDDLLALGYTVLGNAAGEIPGTNGFVPDPTLNDGDKHHFTP